MKVIIREAAYADLDRTPMDCKGSAANGGFRGRVTSPLNGRPAARSRFRIIQVRPKDLSAASWQIRPRNADCPGRACLLSSPQGWA